MRRRRMTWGAPFALCAVTLATAPIAIGCLSASPSDQATCVDDAACGEGFVCALGFCLDPTAQELSTVHIELDPPDDTGLPLQSRLDVDLRAGPRVELEAARGVLVEGAVEAEEGPVAAHVLATPAASIPGRALAVSADAAPQGFALTLVEGGRYAFSAEVPGLPPYAEDDVVLVEGDRAGRQALAPFVAPASVPIEGRVVASDGASTSGIPGLVVHVEDRGKRVSSVGVTDAEGGFVIAASIDAEAPLLVVRPSAENRSFPTVATPIEIGEGLDLGDVELGVVLAPAPFVFRVRQDGAPSGGAQVYFDADVGNGRFTQRRVADEAGRVAVDLPPARYDVVVVGAGDRRAGLLIATGVDLTLLRELTFDLPPPVRYRGTLSDDEGAAVAGASLSLVRIGAADGGEEPALAGIPVLFSATTDEDGDFDVLVDQGTYRVSVRPPLSKSAPSTSVRVEVGATGLAADIVLPPRAVAVGAATFGGAPIVGASIRVFSVLLDEDGAAIPLGQGATGADGRFEIVVPDFTDANGP